MPARRITRRRRRGFWLRRRERRWLRSRKLSASSRTVNDGLRLRWPVSSTNINDCRVLTVPSNWVAKLVVRVPLHIRFLAVVVPHIINANSWARPMAEDARSPDIVKNILSVGPKSGATVVVSVRQRGGVRGRKREIGGERDTMSEGGS